MRRLKFLNAYERYKYAVSAANDRPEPYFRLGYALAAIGSYESAVKFIKQGLDLDPQWPTHGERLEAIFGEDNRLAILSLTERVTGWVREDIRDPDRLFLIGVLLHFNGDNRAAQFFEAAYRLAGSGDHLLAFLQPPAESRDATPGSPQGRPYPQGGRTSPQGGPAAGPYRGTSPAPPPQEPPLPLEAIPGAAVGPPGTRFPTPAPALTPRPTGPIGPLPINPENTRPQATPRQPPLPDSVLPLAANAERHAPHGASQTGRPAVAGPPAAAVAGPCRGASRRAIQFAGPGLADCASAGSRFANPDRRTGPGSFR